MPSEVEARLLVYVVAIGAFFGLHALVRRRAFHLRFHMAVLASLLGASAAALIEPTLLLPLATPLAVAFGVLVLLPSLALMGGRALAGSRRYARAVPLIRAGSVLVGAPPVLRNEARFYRSLAAAEAGDARRCRTELTRLAEDGALPAAVGGVLLAEALPLAVERDWDALLDRLGEAPREAATLRALEARAAAETGDFSRAAAACEELGRLRGAAAHEAQAGRAVLAVAGRATFLERARERNLPVVAQSDGRAELAIARACEAAGRTDDALQLYETALAGGHGVVVREARDGLERCRTGVLRTPTIGTADAEALDRLEERLGAQPPVPPPVPWYRQAVATVLLTLFTTLVSIVVFVVFEPDSRGYLAAGALSKQLVLEGQWWRLASYALLHGGWLHLVMNTTSLLIVGVALERRIGSARTLVVYLLSAFLASPASVWLNGTPIGVGASGGALGVMGALLVVVVRRPELFTRSLRGTWSRILWLSVAATAGIGILEYRIIDNAAHAAGMVVGALVAFAMVRHAGRPASRPTRWLAGVLSVALVASGAIAGLQAPSWYGWRTVASQGATADLPAWMRARDKPPGLWWRPPIEFVVQLLGAPPEELDVEFLFMAVEPGLGTERPLLREDVVSETERRYVFGPHPAQPHGPRALLHVIERRGAYALALTWDLPGTSASFEPVLDRLRESLAAGGGAR